MRAIKLAIPFFFLVLALSCARQTAPTGGPKDTIPPRLISSNPARGALNVNTKSIQLEFTEPIALANPKEQLIITPDINKKYEAVARKRRVIITLEEQLKPNTTYTLNFRDAVQDITEKNPSVNLKLAFSTGNYIDSMRIKGVVRNLLQNKEIKDATVALYESDTFNIFLHKPVYLTKTNEKGIFEFENLKQDTFYLYAIEDKNRNLIADSRNENYGFLTEPIILTSDQDEITIPVLRLDARPLKLTSARPYNTYFNIRTAKGLHQYTIKSPLGDSIYSRYGEDRSNIRIYNTFENIDSMQVSLSLLDSVQHKIDTTLYIKFLQRQVTKEKFAFSVTQSTAIARTGTLEVHGQYSKPIAYINYDSIYFQPDSLTRIPIESNDIEFFPKEGKFILRKNVPKQHLQNPESTTATVQNQRPKANQQQRILYMGKGAFISVELDSTAQFAENIKPLKEEDTGVIIAQIDTAEPYYIVELTNKAGAVLRTSSNRKTTHFNDLPPGEYYLRLIIDKNADGAWSPGNFFKRQEPEPVTYYATEKNVSAINLKANFELGPLLITY